MSDQNPTDADFEQYADQDAEPPGNGISAPDADVPDADAPAADAPDPEAADQDAGPPGDGITAP